MSDFIIYLIKSSICLILFSILFRLLFMKDTFFRFMRITLLSGLVICAILPFIRFRTTKQFAFQKSFAQFEELVKVPPSGKEPVAAFDNPSVPTIQTHTNAANNNTDFKEEQTHISWQDVAIFIYWIGVIVMTFRLLFSLANIFKIIRNSRVQNRNGYRLTICKEDIIPFSFFNRIVLSEKDYFENREGIILHELMHCKKRHNIDVIVSEIFLIAFWFNPVMWSLRNDLREIHEYEADDAVLNRGIDASEYQFLLVRKAVGERRFTSVVNSFNHSQIKNRITMMLKEKTSRWAQLKVLLIAPVMLSLLFAFSKKENGQRGESNFNEIQMHQLEGKQKIPTNQDDPEKMYNLFVEKYSKDGDIGPWKIPLAVQELMLGYFNKMTKEEQDRQTIQIKKEKNNRSKKNQLSKRTQPTNAQLNDWKNADKYVVWIDSKKIENTMLNEYEPKDFSNFIASRIANKKYANTIDNEIYLSRIDLMTNGYYDKKVSAQPDSVITFTKIGDKIISSWYASE